MFNVYMQKLVVTETGKIIVNFNENKKKSLQFLIQYICIRINILYINLCIEFQYIVALES